MNLSVILAVEPIVLKAWWVWLIVAVLVTLIDVALLVRVIRAANRIAYLTERTLPSARNIAAHTTGLGALSVTAKLASEVLNAASSIAQATAGIGDKLANLNRSLGGT